MRHPRFIRTAAIALALGSLCGGILTAQSPRAVIIDTDAGPDDLMAVAFLLARPEVTLEAITISFGLAHQQPGAGHMLRLLELAGRRKVPVYLGRATPRRAHNTFPEAWRTRSDSVTGVSLPAATRSPEPRSAVEFLVDRLGDRSRPVDVLAIGALTIIAEVLEQQPQLAALRSLVIMGGAVDVPGNVAGGGNSQNTTAEWNIYADPAAAQRVITAGVPVLLVPLDATNAVPIDAAVMRDIQQRAATPLGRMVSEILAAASARVLAGQYYAWDPLAAVALVDRAVIRTERLPMSVRLASNEDGRTARDPKGTSIDVALGADPRRFLEAFVSAFR
jgi:inosine-uridine nucleoside N-ribohydrolase